MLSKNLSSVDIFHPQVEDKLFKFKILNDNQTESSLCPKTNKKS